MAELKEGDRIKIPNSHPIGAVWCIDAIVDGMARVSSGSEVTHWFLDDLDDAEMVQRGEGDKDGPLQNTETP